MNMALLKKEKEVCIHCKQGKVVTTNVKRDGWLVICYLASILSFVLMEKNPYFGIFVLGVSSLAFGYLLTRKE